MYRELGALLHRRKQQYMSVDLLIGVRRTYFSVVV